MSSPKSTIQTITPQRAQEWLNQATECANNRRISPTKVTHWANVMRSGSWSETASVIRFDTDGCLQDGQHRLHAVILTGTTIKSVIMTNCDPGDFDKIDTALNRRAGQFFDTTYPGERETAAKLLYQINTNNKIVSSGVRPDLVLATARHWEHELDHWIDSTHELKSVLSFDAAAGLTFTAMAERTPYKSRIAAFLDGVIYGADLSVGDPRLTLHNRVVKIMESARASSSSARHGIPYQHIAYTWEQFIKGESMHKFPGATPRYLWVRKLILPVGYETPTTPDFQNGENESVFQLAAQE